jgi:GTP-binding protein
MTFLPNNSPFLGKEGKYVTSTAVWERLLKEKEANVSIIIERSPVAESFTVKGRGELQLAILIENMAGRDTSFRSPDRK